ncbi:MAG: MerR family transcriptional regulator [Acidimicrobiales bacterium]
MSDPDRERTEPETSGQRPVYSIGAVVKMLGIDAATLRAWEERYALVVPSRSKGGQRVYSRDELDHLRFIAKALEEGVGAGDAHRLLGEELRVTNVVSQPEAEGAMVMVLLAERDRYAAELSEYLLRTEGYDVCLAFDPAGAARLFSHREPHLSIVELMISGGGLGLCSQLAQRGNAPVLAVSALDLADEALAAGASAFLSKPIDPLPFVSTVRDLLGQSALTRPSRKDAKA